MAALLNIFFRAPRPPNQAPKRPPKTILDLWWPLTSLKLTGPARGSHWTESQPEIFRLGSISAGFDFRILADFRRDRFSTNLSLYFSDAGNPSVSISSWILLEFYSTYSDTAPGLAGEQIPSESSLPGSSYKEAKNVKKMFKSAG